MKTKFASPEEAGASFERAFKRLHRPKPRKIYKTAQEVLDEVRKALGTPEGECVIEHAKQMALKSHG